MIGRLKLALRIKSSPATEGRLPGWRMPTPNRETTNVGVNVGVNVGTNRALLAPQESSSGLAKAARWLVIDQ